MEETRNLIWLLREDHYCAIGVIRWDTFKGFVQNRQKTEGVPMGASPVQRMIVRDTEQEKQNREQAENREEAAM